MEYRYSSVQPTSDTHTYLLPAVRAALKPFAAPRCVFELGCGNGVVAGALSNLGYSITAIDTSESGVRFARTAAPDGRIEVGSAYDDLAGRYGRFDVVLSLEVIEHLLSPARCAEVIADLLNPGGRAIISTPYHGYLKNLAIAAVGKWDLHHTALWEGGHIKFWSRATLAKLFRSAGLVEVAFYRVGRIPPLAKSMVCVFAKPAARSDRPV